MVKLVGEGELIIKVQFYSIFTMKTNPEGLAMLGYAAVLADLGMSTVKGVTEEVGYRDVSQKKVTKNIVNTD